MAVLSFDEEFQRAQPRNPFANGFEGESWMARWCENDCARLDDCDLLTVAYLGRTPARWAQPRPGHLNQYDCLEYTVENQ